MAFLDRQDVLRAASRERVRTSKSDAEILREARQSTLDRYDVFLCHSSMDRELIVGAKRLIEERELTVYVDWIDDPQLSRAQVDAKTADHLRKRMRQCGSLFYAHTPNASLSRWCPWELGYFDALDPDRCRVFVLPILESGQRYEGQEYLDLYKPVDLDTWQKPPPRVATDTGSEFRRKMLANAFGLRTPRGPFL